MALAWFRNLLTGSIISGDLDADPAFLAIIQTRRTDVAYGFVYELAIDAQPGQLTGEELTNREEIIARINAAVSPSPPVTIYDYQGDGTPLSLRATALAAAAAAPRTTPGV